MRPQLRNAVILAAAGVALTACADNTVPAPTGPDAASRRNSPSASLAVPACDITVLKGHARDYAKSSRDVLLTILGDLQTAVKNGPSAAGTDKVFDGLARVAAIRGTTDQKSGVTGSVFDGLVTGLLGCAQSSVLANTEDQDFSGALGTSWLFEVRGKNNTPARQYDDLTGWSYQRGSASPATWWAAGPGGTSWNSSITSSTLPKRFLIYGYPEPGFLTINGKFGSAFETRTIPKISPTFGVSLKLGLCFADAVNITGTQRLNHNNEFVPNTALTCGTGPAPISVASTSGALGRLNPVSLAQRAVGFFAPQPAYAAFIVGAVGGGVSELSPSAVYDLSAIDLLKELGTIADGRVSRALETTVSVPTYGKSVIVRAMTKPSTAEPISEPIVGVPIELSIAGNQSSIAFFSVGGVPAVTVTRTTDAAGYANFGDVLLTKAGGYQLAFKVSFDGVTGPPLLSNSFNFQNK